MYRNTLNLSFSAIFKIVIQLLVLAVSSRILEPVDFGLIAIYTLVLSLFEVLVKQGLIQSYVKNATPSHKKLLCLTKYYLINSVILFVFLYTLNFFFELSYERFYKELIVLLCFSLLISILSSLVVAHMSITDQVDRIISTEIRASLISSLLICLPLLVLTKRWEVMVFVKLASDLVILSSVINKKVYSYLRVSLFSKLGMLNEIRPLMRFGFFITLARLFNVLSLRSHELVIQSGFGMSQLGSYNRANALVNVPIEITNQVLEKLFFPVMSKQRKHGQIPSNKQDTYSIIFFLAMLLAFTGQAFSEVIIPFALGEQWYNIIGVFNLLLLFSVFRIFYKINDVFIKSQGKANFILYLNLIQFSALVFLLLVFGYSDIFHVINAVGLSYSLRYLLSLFLVKKLHVVFNSFYRSIFLAISYLFCVQWVVINAS